MAYDKINWENSPSTVTPISATNLGKMDTGIFDNDAKITTLETDKVDKVEGKGLSTEDFTNALLTKLNGVAANANKYTLPSATSSANGGMKMSTKATHTLSTTWTSSLQTVVVTGATSTNVIEVFPSTAMTETQMTAYAGALFIVSAQTTNSITLKCLGAVPTITLPIQTIVRRDL